MRNVYLELWIVKLELTFDKLEVRNVNWDVKKGEKSTWTVNDQLGADKCQVRGDKCQQRCERCQSETEKSQLRNEKGRDWINMLNNYISLSVIRRIRIKLTIKSHSFFGRFSCNFEHV